MTGPLTARSAPGGGIDATIDSRGIAHLILDRADVGNALGPELVSSARSFLREVQETTGLRALVLRGNGKHFCCGADLEWMRSLQGLEPRRIAQESAPMLKLMQELDELPVPVIGVVQGHTVAGGMGLLASCDLVIAHRDAMFQIAETRLGLIPATIAPFLLRKIGYSNLRSLACTARCVDCSTMLGAGLLHRVTDDLDAALQAALAEILQTAPEAVALCKRMLKEMAVAAGSDLTQTSLEWVAESRGLACAVEGVDAFLSKRNPGWWP